jgi:hypothetical protein
MSAVTEICIKYPGGPTRITGTGLMSVGPYKNEKGAVAVAKKVEGLWFVGGGPPCYMLQVPGIIGQLRGVGT